jgi:hypothetical protein
VRRKPKTKSRGDEQNPDMRRDAPGASGHVTTKPSISNIGGHAEGVHFVNPAPTRGRIRVLPREICEVHGGQLAVLGAGGPALKTEQKSAEGIVGRGRLAEGPNAASAGCAPDGSGDGSRAG